MSAQPEYEYDLKIIVVDDDLLTELATFMKAGWVIAPGIKPVALYHMIKPKVQVEAPAPVEIAAPETPAHDFGGAIAKLNINDALVLTLGPDGNPK